MSDCSLCKKKIEPGTRAVSIIGGQFPKDDPDFFMVDEGILRESHAHFDCLTQLALLFIEQRRAPHPRGSK